MGELLGANKIIFVEVATENEVQFTSLRQVDVETGEIDKTLTSKCSANFESLIQTCLPELTHKFTHFEEEQFSTSNLVSKPKERKKLSLIIESDTPKESPNQKAFFFGNLGLGFGPAYSMANPLEKETAPISELAELGFNLFNDWKPSVLLGLGFLTSHPMSIGGRLSFHNFYTQINKTFVFSPEDSDLNNINFESIGLGYHYPYNSFWGQIDINYMKKNEEDFNDNQSKEQYFHLGLGIGMNLF